MAFNANAAFVMQLEDPNVAGSLISISDGSTLDQYGTVGLTDGTILYNGSVGSFLVTVSTGISKPILGPGEIHLDSVEVSGSTGGSLLISITDTDFLGPMSEFTANYGIVTDGSVDLSFLYDENNNEFDGSEFASGGSYGNTVFAEEITGSVNPSSTYSLSILAEVTHDAAMDITSFDAEINPVPVPAALWLFASGLLTLLSLRKSQV